MHLIVRLPSFYAALPAISDLWSNYGTDTATASRYAARKLATADARLEALQRQAQFGTGRVGAGGRGWNAWAQWISIFLVLISLVNAAYLVTRRRKYQMVLRRVSCGSLNLAGASPELIVIPFGAWQDPLSSPNAKAAMLTFAPDRPAPTFAQKLRRQFLERFGWATPEQEDAAFPVQELNVWVPDHAIWSLRLFTCVLDFPRFQGLPKLTVLRTTGCIRRLLRSCTTCCRLPILSFLCSAVLSSQRR